jgi:hypothetical protein
MPAIESSIIIPDPIAPSRPISYPSASIPASAAPVIVKNNIALASPPANPPPSPTIAQVLTAIPLGYQFAFNQVVLPIGATNVMSSYRIYRNMMANSFSGATLIRTIIHDPTHQGSIIFQDSTGGGKNYSYFIKSVDTDGNVSSPQAAQPGSVTSGNANPNIASSVGVTSGPGTSGTTYSVIPEMTETITTKGNDVLLILTLSLSVNTGHFGNVAFFMDGVQLTPDYFFQPGTGVTVGVSLSFIANPSAASHTFDARWKVDSAGGAIGTTGIGRSFQVVELG